MGFVKGIVGADHRRITYEEGKFSVVEEG